jgi:hypothetical protein
MIRHPPAESIGDGPCPLCEEHKTIEINGFCPSCNGRALHELEWDELLRTHERAIDEFFTEAAR